MNRSLYQYKIKVLILTLNAIDYCISHNVMARLKNEFHRIID